MGRRREDRLLEFLKRITGGGSRSGEPPTSQQPSPPSPPERAQFPPVPSWKPNFAPTLDAVVERIDFYSNGHRDFAVFTNGTVAVLPGGLSDEHAVEHATVALHKVFHAHPDRHPAPMKDGNIFVRFNHGLAVVVFEDVVQTHREEIERRHLDALATHEVLITPDGPNQFDDFGKRALYGRCYMFMDAQAPKVVRLHRHA